MSILTGDLPNIRQMYCAAPGKKLVHADWSQVEPRLMSIIAPDPQLAADIAVGDSGGEDLYEVQARNYFSIPADQPIKKEARRNTKVVHLGSSYAAITRTVYDQALRQMPELKYSVCKAIHDKWKRRYVGTVNYWHKEYAHVLSCGYSESRILHRRYYYPEKPEISKTANYPIQATASDICNICILQVREKVARITGGEARILTNFYDAIDIECDDALVWVCKGILKDTMEQGFELGDKEHSFPVKLSVGQLWSEV